MPMHSSPLPWDPVNADGRSQPIEVPEFAGRLPGRYAEEGILNPADLSRHVLAVGETGAGKTHSVVAPLLGALVRYRRDDPENRMSLLVIDPKVELESTIQDELGDAPQRPVRFDLSGARQLDYFVHLDRRALTGLTVLDEVGHLDPAYARNLVSENASWHARARDVLAALIDLHDSLRQEQIDLWVLLRHYVTEGFGIPGSGKSRATVSVARIDVAPEVRNAVTLWFRNIDRGRLYHDPRNYFRAHRAFLEALMRLSNESDSGGGSEVQRALFDLLIQLAEATKIERATEAALQLSVLRNLYPSGYLSVLALAHSMAVQLSDEHFARALYLNPVEPPESGYLDVQQCIESGGIILYAPIRRDRVSRIVGKALKRIFFASCFQRASKFRGVAYVCDEFHQFASADEIAGEERFLDRCRAYRVSCILATQSIQSIERELMREMSPAHAAAATLVILGNCATKFVFRATDSDSAHYLRSMIAAPSFEGPHVLDIRPLTSLAPGCAYALLCNGPSGIADLRR